MRLSLVFPAWCQALGEFQKVAKSASTFPPLNLALVAAMAEQAGWEVQLLDGEAEDLDLPDLVRRIAAFGPDLIGLTATTPFFHAVASAAEEFKKHWDVPIIVGGTHATILREQAFLPSFEFLVLGECERSFPEFLRRFAAGERHIDVPGIARRQHGEVIYRGDAPRLEDLDQAPYPARHLLPNEKYVVGTLRGKRQYTSLQMSRGCPYRCVFCANELYGKKPRWRSLENVLGELHLVVNEMGIRHVYFVDDTLTLYRDFVLALCDGIKRRGLDFTFEGSTRANLWDRGLAARLAECGLIRISFGLETADPAIRKIIRKEVPLESYAESNRINNQLGIETINSVMLGLPGETRESVEKTVDFLCRSRDIHHATYGIAVPYPGTPLFEMAEKGEHGLKLLTRDFSRYQRYGSATMEVNGLSPGELLSLQKQGLRRIYSCWWRIIPMLKRHGLRAILAPAASALGACLRPRWSGRG